jgi:hypothetical protein
MTFVQQSVHEHATNWWEVGVTAGASLVAAAIGALVVFLTTRSSIRSAVRAQIEDRRSDRRAQGLAALRGLVIEGLANADLMDDRSHIPLRTSQLEIALPFVYFLDQPLVAAVQDSVTKVARFNQWVATVNALGGEDRQRAIALRKAAQNVLTQHAASYKSDLETTVWEVHEWLSARTDAAETGFEK